MFLYFRVIWIACVSAAMILFVYQVADRTLVYFDYNTTVSVKVRYTDVVPFPAVTVCNINTFRYVSLLKNNLVLFKLCRYWPNQMC